MTFAERSTQIVSTSVYSVMWSFPTIWIPDIKLAKWHSYSLKIESNTCVVMDLKENTKAYL